MAASRSGLPPARRWLILGRSGLLLSCYCFALLTDERDLVAHIHLAALFNVYFRQGSVFGRFPFHRRLIGFDLSNHFAG